MFLFLEHTISDHTMFLHQTTVLAYPASVTYDKAPLSRNYVSGETTPTRSRGIPSATVGGRGAVEKAGLRDQRGGIIQVQAASDA